jgi:hypothetical protein
LTESARGPHRRIEHEDTEFEAIQDIFSDKVWGPIHQIGRKKFRIFKHSRCADIDSRGTNCYKQKPNGAVIELHGEALMNELLKGAVGDSNPLFKDP